MDEAFDALDINERTELGGGGDGPFDDVHHVEFLGDFFEGFCVFFLGNFFARKFELEGGAIEGGDMDIYGLGQPFASLVGANTAVLIGRRRPKATHVGSALLPSCYEQSCTA